MSSVKTIVLHGLFSYPSLFQTPEDVLSHVFSVIGNAYQWNDKGEVESEDITISDDIDVLYNDGLTKLEIDRLQTLVDVHSLLKQGIIPIDSPKHKSALRIVNLRYDMYREQINMYRRASDRMFGEHGEYTIFDRVYKMQYTAYNMYPCCTDYALMFNIPPNISIDWALTCSDWMTSVKYSIMQNNDFIETMQEKNQRYLEHIPGALNKCRIKIEEQLTERTK